jgi:hypothetical protein
MIRPFRINSEAIRQLNAPRKHRVWRPSPLQFIAVVTVIIGVASRVG